MVLEGKLVKTIVFYQRKSRDRPFRVHGSDPTLTISAACAQKLVPETLATSTPTPKRIRQNPSVQALFGEYFIDVYFVQE